MKHSIKDIDEDTLEDTSASKRAHLLHSNLPIIYNHVETNTSLSINHSHFQLNQHRSLYWLQYKDPKPCRKIAAFDLDNTLTIALEQGESERVQGKWKMFGGDLLIRDKLTELHDSGYKIVVFSNQYNLPARERHWQSFLLKLKLLLQTIDVPSQAFLATAKDDYRKPSSGMWEHFLNHCNKISSVDPTAHNVDMKNSFFIGDAAGRISGWKPGKSSDFSDSDRKFAMKIGLPFYTPEEFFLGEPQAPFEWHAESTKTSNYKNKKKKPMPHLNSLKDFGFTHR